MEEALIRDVWIETGRPGINRLFHEIKRRRGLRHITEKQVRQFLSKQPSQQVFRPTPQSDGKINASDLNQAWQVDLADYSKARDEKQ